MTRRIFTTILTLSLAIAFAGTMLAHGDAIHVTGFVRAINADSVTVETAKHEMITVLLTPKMEVTRSNVKASLSDLKVGDRVVIHAEKNHDGKLAAESVAFGPAQAAAAHAADKH
jgi:Cu/Ag efflux protein CusF